jgi:anti-sigma B factor antagonist
VARYQATVQSYRPAAESFAYLATFSNAADWDPGVLAGEQLDPGPVRPGTRFRRVVPVRGELDLATADGLAAQGRAAIARRIWLLLLDLTGLSFCDACGLSALVKIANHADAAGCRYGLIGPQPQVARLLRITGLDQRIPVFTSINDALTHLAAGLSAPSAVVD